MEYKCKMCGGNLLLEPGDRIGVCESCGTRQTVGGLDDARRATQYELANHYRRSGDYDRAANVFSRILEGDARDAEAYWSLVLCRYGIEYVTDPKTQKMVPTLNRMQRAPLSKDADYLKALELADANARALYQQEAAAISAIQKRYFTIIAGEKPYDVFISYKETEDATGARTVDSELAHRIYNELTDMGLRVFYSHITLKDMLGKDYEATIYAALHSAKVMLLVTTSAAHANAVWVRNEWTRYLLLMNDTEGRTLIPVYRDMDPYDLPEELQALNLQGLNLAELAAMQTLKSTIGRLFADKTAQKAKAPRTVATAAADEAAPMREKAYKELAASHYASAKTLFQRVLDEINEKDAHACIGLMLAKSQVICANEDEGLKKYDYYLDDQEEFTRALECAQGEYKQSLAQLLDKQQAKRYKQAQEQATAAWASSKRAMQKAQAYNQAHQAEGAQKKTKQEEAAEDKSAAAKKPPTAEEAMQRMILSCDCVPALSNALDEHQSTAADFSCLNGYQDSETLAREHSLARFDIQQQIILLAIQAGKPDEARALFNDLLTYPERSKEKKELDEGIKEALEQRNKRVQQRARRRARKRVRLTVLAAAMPVILGILCYVGPTSVLISSLAGRPGPLYLIGLYLLLGLGHGILAGVMEHYNAKLREFFYQACAALVALDVFLFNARMGGVFDYIGGAVYALVMAALYILFVYIGGNIASHRLGDGKYDLELFFFN